MTEAVAEAPKGPIRPEFNQADFVVDDLLDKNKTLQKENALLRAAVAERDSFIEANAETLGLDMTPPVAPTPLPNRQARRAAPKPTKQKAGK